VMEDMGNREERSQKEQEHSQENRFMVFHSTGLHSTMATKSFKFQDYFYTRAPSNTQRLDK
ncbi:12208_t:CDS:2, partial [Funneliformis mosseae]